MNTPYKNNSGQFLSKALFFELNDLDQSQILYTLKDEDHKGYPSLYRLYMEMEDQTEYIFSKKYFYGWDHWNKLTKTSWFKPFISRWREELTLLFRSRLIAKLLHKANSDDKDSLTAQKYLLEKGWLKTPKVPEVKQRVGRPNKEILVDEISSLDLNNDFNRIIGTVQ